MKLVNQKAELWQQGPTEEDMWNHIARCTRVCYQSTPKNKEESGEDFCKRTILLNKHYGMLEHGTMYLIIPYDEDHVLTCRMYEKNPYSKIKIVYDKCYITTNYRVILENGWEEDLDYWSEPTEFHEKRYTLSLITSIGIGRELCRHRKFSFAQESTRYCKYGKDDMEFIIPYWANLNPGPYETASNGYIGDGFCEDYSVGSNETQFLSSLSSAESFYKRLLINDLKAQEAREVLPLALKSQLIMTGFESDWKDFLDKRLFEKTGKVHEDMRELAKQIFELV
jgi:thymidylate synthase (FAD)